MKIHEAPHARQQFGERVPGPGPALDGSSSASSSGAETRCSLRKAPWVFESDVPFPGCGPSAGRRQNGWRCIQISLRGGREFGMAPEWLPLVLAPCPASARKRRGQGYSWTRHPRCGRACLQRHRFRGPPSATILHP